MQHVVCEGAPRDLGLDQGRACRAAIRSDAAALGWSRSVGRTRSGRGSDPFLARDLTRYFPHLDERTQGLAVGAGLAREALLALLGAEIAAAQAFLLGVSIRGGALELALGAPPSATGWLLRSMHADGGHRTLTLARPGLAAALAGVNEHGLAGAVEVLVPASAEERLRVPGLLLLDGCLERLDGVEKALEWCERRPAGGRARLWFADAGGAVGGVEIDGEGRRRLASPPSTVDREAVLRVRLRPATRELATDDGTVERIPIEAAPPGDGDAARAALHA
jgi:hypothetical protein